MCQVGRRMTLTQFRARCATRSRLREGSYCNDQHQMPLFAGKGMQARLEAGHTSSARDFTGLCRGS